MKQETTLNRPNWLGSDVGIVLKTITVPKTFIGTTVTENNRKIVKSGTLITDTVIGKGLLYNDVDITDDNRVASIMIRGSYINKSLPTALTTEVDELAKLGLYSIAYADTVVSTGEVL